MSRWQYQVVDVKPTFAGAFAPARSREQLQATLDRMGAQGWELVSSTLGAGLTRLVFKRPA